MSIHQAKFVCAPTAASPVFVKTIYTENPEQPLEAQTTLIVIVNTSQLSKLK